MSNRTYRALLVANSTFPNDRQNLPDLEGPRNDPALLRDALCDDRYGLFPTDNVRLVTERTSAEVLEETEEFLRSAHRDDILLLYYSGHGMLDKANELYLCARNSRTDRPLATAIMASHLRTMMDRSGAAATIVVLDCCHSGAFKGGDLADRLTGRGRFVLTSCRTGELANDAHTRNHASLFTHHLVQGMLGGAADRDADGFVKLDDLYTYIHDHLTAERRQIPEKSFAGSGDIPIARRAATANNLTTTGLVDPSTTKPILDVDPPVIELIDVEPAEDLPPERIAVINRGGGELAWTARCLGDPEWVTLERDEHGLLLHLQPPRPGINRANIEIRESRTSVIKSIRLLVRVSAAGLGPTALQPTQMAGRAQRAGAVPKFEQPPEQLATHGHAFISYVREDAEAVDRLQGVLEQAGIHVWRDTHDLWPGDDWRAKIRQAITDEAMVFIACFSDNSLNRPATYQNEELNLGIEQLRVRPSDQPWLIPVRFSDCRLPSFDLGAGRTLDSLQRVDLFGNRYRWEEGTARLITGVYRILSSRTEHDGPVDGDSESGTGVPPPTTTSAARSVGDQVDDGSLQTPGGSRTTTHRIPSFLGGLHIFEGHRRSVNAVCTLQVGDETLLASASTDKTIRLWNPATGFSRRSEGHAGLTASVRAICAVPVGANTLLASAGDDKTIRLWDPATGLPASMPLKGHTASVNAVCSVQIGDTTRLASASTDRTIRLWDPATGHPISPPLKGHTASVNAVCSVQIGDTTRLASASTDRTIRLWDPATGHPIGPPLKGHASRIYDICAVPAGDRVLLASASRDKTVRLWDPLHFLT